MATKKATKKAKKHIVKKVRGERVDCTEAGSKLKRFNQRKAGIKQKKVERATIEW